MFRHRRLAALSAAVLALVVASNALAASAVPFPWTVGFHNPYFGRDMTSSTGTFCEWYHSTDSTYNNPKNYPGAAEKYTYISLWYYGSSGVEQIGIKATYANTGAQQVYCWRGFLPSNVYFFRFEKSDYSDGVYIYAAGNVQNH